MLDDFTNGNPELQVRFNELLAVARKVENITGGGLVKVQHTANGININVERRGIGNRSGTIIRKGFVKAAPTASEDTVDVYLDTDATGDEVEVDFENMISGDTDLDNCFPPLVDGLCVPVWNDGGTWRPCFPMGVIDRCA